VRRGYPPRNLPRWVVPLQCKPLNQVLLHHLQGLCCLLQLNLCSGKPVLLEAHYQQHRPLPFERWMPRQTGVDPVVVKQLQGIGQELIGKKELHFVHSVSCGICNP